MRGVRTFPARLVAAALALVALALPATAAGKSFSMPEVRVDATLGTDGSLTVSEARTFAFEGDFTRVYWDLEPPLGGSIDAVSVTGPDGIMPPAIEEGRPAGFSRILANGTMTRVEAYGQMSDTTITYTLRYRVKGAATRWADTSELYWQVVTANWSEGTGRLDAVINLPSAVAADQVRVWAHGPLTGLVRKEPDGTVSLRVTDLPASTFVEARVLFPAEALSALPAGSTARLQAVLEEEKGLAEAANARREAARREVAEQEAFDRRMDAIVGGLAAGLPLVLLVVAIPLFVAYGREHPVSFKGRYFREEPADLHPALVSYLMHMGAIEDVSISAALMRLADRGAIRMEPVTESKPWLFGVKEESTYRLTLVREKWDSLEILDRNLLSFLFTEIARDDTFTVEELKSLAKVKAQEFQDGIKSFKSLAAQEAETMDLVEQSTRWLRSLTWAVAFVAGGATFFGTCVAENVVAAAVGGPATLALAVLASQMKRRSPAAADLFAKYRALRAYLVDFSRLDEAPPASVVLWNHFLVLAVVFGVADRVIQQLRVRVPEVVGDPGFATTYWWATASPGYASPVSALTSGLASASSIATSTLSSSSGGGGGFSGGGGFGGGGFGGGGGGGAD